MGWFFWPKAPIPISTQQGTYPIPSRTLKKMGSLFARLYVLIRQAPVLWATVFVGLTAGVVYSALQIGLDEDITRTLPNSEAFATYQRLYRNSNVAGNMVLAIGPTDSVDLGTLLDLADTLNDRLQHLPDTLVREVLHTTTDRKPNLGHTISGLPIFLNANQLDSLQLALSDSGLASGFTRLTEGLGGLSAMVLKEVYTQDPLLLTVPVLRNLEGLKAGANLNLQDGYFLSPDGRYVLVFVNPVHPPTETKANGILIELLEKQRDSLTQIAGTAEVLLFGGPVIALTNARQIRHDSTYAGILGGVLILLLLLIWFRSIAVPFIFLLPAAFGMGSALAIMALTQGSISALAIGAGSVVLGIAMDYAFHFLNHYRHTGSAEQTLKEMGTPLIIGSVTTVFALLALRFLHSEVLRDLGTFGALTLAFTALFVLVVMPHLASLLPTQIDSKTKRKIKTRSLLLPGFLVILVGTVGLAPFANKVQFEDDLNKINYFPEHLQRAQDIISGPGTVETVFVSHTSPDLFKALDESHRLKLLLDSSLHQSVPASVSVAQLFPPSKQILTNKQIWEDFLSEKGAHIKARMMAEAESFGVNQRLISAYDTLLASVPNAEHYLAQLMANDPTYAAMYFSAETEGKLNHTLISTLRVKASDKEKVASELKAQGFEIVARASLAQALVSAVSNDLNQLLMLTGGMVFLVLLITYGRIELALITFLPMALSWVWIMGICGLTGLKFNMVNVLITTFIFGLGDDFAIFISDGYLSKFKTGVNKLGSYRGAILLSALTTIIGTGVLVVAKHPALQSIAMLSVTGMVCVVVVSLLLQPVLYHVFVGYRQRLGLPPLTWLNLLTSLISFGWFLIGCLILSAILLLILPIPARKAWKQRFMLSLISALTMSVVKIMTHVKREIINPDDLSRPAIIIANHNSFVDLLWIIGYSPKILLVTNEWVWNSPFFGFFIRYVDYIRAAEGREFSLDMIRKKVAEGYSIVIFPEGTRSADGRIGRFKKGAFFLAEQLGLDLLPLVTHGLHQVLPKNDFVVNRTTITLKFLPRISPTDTSFGIGYRDRQKQISKHFKREYEQIRAMRETPHYYANWVGRQYLFRGPVLEWYVRIKLKLENNFDEIVRHVPENGRVYDLGCGYGYLSLMLAMTADRQRDVIGVDYDFEKIEVAQNVPYKGGNVRFKQADLSQFEPKDADCFIIKDVLHYLRPEHQTQLLERCAKALRHGGTIIIRDGMRDDETKKHQVTQLTEVFSTKLFGFNRADEELVFPTEEELRIFAKNHAMHVERVGNNQSSNVILVLTRA